MVNEEYAVLGERIMAQALFRLAAPTAVPPLPKAPGRLRLKDNLNPVGRGYYSLSTLLCTPC